MLELPNRFDFDGQSVAWGVMGDGPPLVAVHGTPFSSQVWRRIVPHLSSRYRVYYYDLLGYGHSEMAYGQDVSLGIQNRLLAVLFAAWHLHGPDVLAHDFGGATVLRAALLNGLRYRSLTLVDPVAVAPWGSTFVQHVRQFEPAFAGLPDYAHCALLGAYLQTAAHSRLEETALAVYSAPWTGSPGQGAFYRQIAQMDQRFTDEIESLLPGLGCPVRLLWGENDTWIPVARGRKLAAMLGGVPLEIVRDSGHLMQEDRPEAIVAAMLG